MTYRSTLLLSVLLVGGLGLPPLACSSTSSSFSATPCADKPETDDLCDTPGDTCEYHDDAGDRCTATCNDKQIWKADCLFDPCYPDPQSARCICWQTDGTENCPATKPTHGDSCDPYDCQESCEYFGDPCGEDIAAGCSLDGVWEVSPPSCR